MKGRKTMSSTPLPPYSFIEVRKWVREQAHEAGERMSDVQSRRAARSWIRDRETEQKTAERVAEEGGISCLTYADDTGEDAVDAVMAEPKTDAATLTKALRS